jgi:hypothetical protein
MSENLRSILSCLDSTLSPHWSYFQVRMWPDSQLDQSLKSGLFVPAPVYSPATCTQCGSPADVVECASSETEVWCKCEACGPHRVPVDQAGGWRLAVGRFLELLNAALGNAGRPLELVRDRIWRLTQWHCAGASRNTYLARGLARRDAREVIEQARFPSGSVVFVPTQFPRRELQIEPLPRLISLVDALSWAGNALALDKPYIEMQLAAAAAGAGKHVPAVSRRSSRLSTIEALKRELVEHLRSARDHALDAQRRGGEAELLPRPTQERLARQLGVSKATVCRCLEDPSARELRRLWEAAGDLGRLMT